MKGTEIFGEMLSRINKSIHHGEHGEKNRPGLQSWPETRSGVGHLEGVLHLITIELFFLRRHDQSRSRSIGGIEIYPHQDEREPKRQ